MLCRTDVSLTRKTCATLCLIEPADALSLPRLTKHSCDADDAVASPLGTFLAGRGAAAHDGSDDAVLTLVLHRERLRRQQSDVVAAQQRVRARRQGAPLEAGQRLGGAGRMAVGNDRALALVEHGDAHGKHVARLRRRTARRGRGARHGEAEVVDARERGGALIGSISMRECASRAAAQLAPRRSHGVRHVLRRAARAAAWETRAPAADQHIHTERRRAMPSCKGRAASSRAAVTLHPSPLHPHHRCRPLAHAVHPLPPLAAPHYARSRRSSDTDR